MSHINYFILFESLGFLAFSVIFARELYQKNFRHIFELVSCAIFGILLEIGNTYLAHTYTYSQNFLVNLVHVPIVIGLGWAVIIYAAMQLSDQYNMPWTLRPFMDALTVVILDLAIDAVAIRLGFWQWSIPLDKEWYGVPFENLIGWILVALSFSFMVRFIRTLNFKRWGTRILMLFSPIIAYLGLMLGLTVFSVVAILPYQINNWTTLLHFSYRPDFAILFNPQVVFWKTIFFVVIVTELVHIVIGSFIKYRHKFLKNFDLLSFSALTGIHLFFLIAIYSTGLYRELPILAFLSVISLFFHLLIHFLPYLISHKNTVYFFKSVQEKINDRQEKLNEIVKINLK